MILLGAARGTASAQYQIDSWTTEQGLPQSTVMGVNQTPDGFIWVATLGGLVRFDGVNFRVFDTASNPELPNSRLGGITVDNEGQLWVVTQDRALLRFVDGKFRVSSAADGLPAKVLVRTNLFQGRLLAETAGGSVIWQHGRFVPFAYPMPPGSGAMTEVGESAAGARWYRDSAGRAYRVEGGRFTRTMAWPAGGAARVYEDRAGRLWLRNLRNSQLLCIVGDTVRSYGAKDGVPPISVLWVREDPDGTLWFAEQAGLVRFRDGRFTSYTKADGLPATYVNSVFEDREGTHWVATQGGLARLTERPISSFTVADGLAATNTYPMLKDRRGDIWIGGWTGLTRYHNGTFENVSARCGVVGRNILSLLEDRDGAIWIGLYGGGLRRIDHDGDGPVTAVSGPGAPDVAYVMYQGRGSDIWIGGDAGAIRCHDGRFDRPLAGTAAVNTFHEDERGTLWIGSDAGLARYEHGVLTKVGETDGFSGRRVRVIHGDSAGTLWIGTYDTGLFRYRDGTFTRYTTDQGLPANGAFEILEDDHARFWVTSNSGIYRVAKAALDDVAAGRRRSVTAVTYGREDGMANQECNGLGRPAGVRADDGRFWFPTQGGVAVVDPRAAGTQPAPPVSILDVTVAGVAVSSRDAIEIASGSSAVEVHYAALTFIRPELARFKYRLEPLDTDWTDAHNDRAARFARLPYGSFHFHVIAANRDGVWNDTGASIAIVVVPPFWRTTWFLVLVVVAVMAAGFSGHRVRLGVIERRQAVQQAFAQQLIDSQETDRKRIASELHDGVSQTLVVMRNWASLGEQALPPDNAVRRRLGEIATAASQALGEVREVVQDLVPYHLERLGLVAAVRDAAARVADASGIPITCRLADIDRPVSTEIALKLFRVVQEGLNNIVKHSGATSASLDLTLEPARARLTIRDNGKGFVPKAVTPTAAGHGFGLVGISERTRMMGGDLTIDSAPGRGTTITIVVPLADLADT